MQRFICQVFSRLVFNRWICLLLIAGSVNAAYAVSVSSAIFNPSSIIEGGSSTLSWSASGASYCYVDGQQAGTSGSKSYSSVITTKQVTVTCYAPPQMGGGSASKTATLTVTPPPAPGVPTSPAVSTTSITATESTSHCSAQNPGPCIPQYYANISVSWGVATGVVSRYEVQQQKDGGSWSSSVNLTSRSLSRTLEPGTWRFRIRACNGSGCSPFVSPSNVLVKYPVPSVPSGMTVSPTTTTATSVSASWSSASGYVTRYEAERRLGTGAWAAFSTANVTSANSSGMSVGSWSFRVRACNATGCSGYRSGNTVAIQDPTPGIPGSLSASPAKTTANQVSVQWHTATGTVTRYEIERRFNGGTWSQFYSGMGEGSPTMPNVPQVLSTGMSIGDWDFRIRACNNTVCSSDQSGNTVTIQHQIPGQPAAINLPTVNTTETYINVGWEAASGHVTHYIAERRLGLNTWEVFYSGPNMSAVSNNMTVGHWGFKVQACNDTGCGVYRESNGLTIEHPIPGVTTVSHLLDVTASGTMPYSAEANSLGDATIRVPVDVVPGVNGHQPNLALTYSSNRLRKLASEGVGEDFVGSGWQLGGISSIRPCGKKTSTHTPADLGDGHYMPLCLDGRLLVQNNPGPIYESGDKMGWLITPWSLEEHEFVLFDDSGIKVRASTGQPEVGQNGKYKVYYPDGSVSEYGYTEDSYMRVHYCFGNDPNVPMRNDCQNQDGIIHDVDTWGHYINKHTDAFGNVINYEYYKDDKRGFIMPKRITYGHNPSKVPGQTFDTVIEFGYQQRVPQINTISSPYGPYMVPPVEVDGQSVPYLEYVRWLRGGYATGVPTAINKITIKHGGVNVREYNLVHEEIESSFQVMQLRHIQQCGYKQGNRDCLTPLTIDWEGSYHAVEENVLRVAEIRDNQGSWTQFEYSKVEPNAGGVYFSSSPFGPLPEDYRPPEDPDPAKPQTPIVLTELRTSNGLGGHRTLRYRYMGRGNFSNTGWGFLGYNAVRIEDVDRGVFTYRQYTTDTKLISRSTAEVVTLGEWGTGGSQTLSRQTSILGKTYLRHGQHSFKGPSGTIMRQNAFSYYIYPQHTINYRYEEGQQVGVLIHSQAPEFAPATDGDPTHFQYPLLRETTTSRWVDDVVISKKGNTNALWGYYQLDSYTGVQRSKQVDVDYDENRAYDALQVSFPRRTESRVYEGDVTGVAEQTVVAERSAYLIDGKARALIGSETGFKGDPELEGTTTYAYDSRGNQTTVTVSGPSITTRSTSRGDFAAHRYPQTLTNTLGQSVTVNYDTATGRPLYAEDLNQLPVTTDYDAFGRVTTVTNSDGVTVTTQYDTCFSLGTCPVVNNVSAYRRVWVSSPVAPDTYQYLDDLGREIRLETVSFDGTQAIYLDTHYDALGQVAKQSLPYFKNETPLYVVFDYDALGRLIKTSQPDGSYKRLDYGVEGTQKVVTRTNYVLDSNKAFAETRVHKSYFNVIDEVVKTTDAFGTPKQISTEFAFYATGLTKNIEVGGQQVASFTYDAAGNRTQLVDQNVGTVTSTYNALGQLTKVVDNALQETSYLYDTEGRPIEQVSLDGTQTWVYDPVDHIGGLDYVQFVDNRTGYNHTKTMYYNTAFEGHPHKLKEMVSDIEIPGYTRAYSQTFTYDLLGRPESVTHPSGVTIYNSYNERGYLDSVTDELGNALQTVLQVDVLGNVSEMSYGNGITNTRTFNPQDGRLKSVLTEKGTTKLQNSTYAWRTDGLMESRTHNLGTVQTESFSYDDLGRLTGSIASVNGASRTTSTSYALNGNILSRSASNSAGNEETNVTDYAYGTSTNAGPNAVSSVVINGEAHTLYYNANGGITHYDATTSADKYVQWTARGKPWRITKGTSENDLDPDARDEIAYGVDGLRYYKKSTWKDSQGVQQSEITFYEGNYEEVLPANDPDYQKVERTRINSHIMHVRTTDYLNVQEEKNEFFHKDHLGSIEAITDGEGNILQRMSFDAFGARRKTDWLGKLTDAETEALLAQVGIGTSRGYTGHEHLDRTGLIHMNGRVYDPTLARFLSADPIVQAPYYSQSYNRYTYVWNNPMGMTDPSGYLGTDSLDKDTKDKDKPNNPEGKDKNKAPKTTTVTANKYGNGYTITYGTGMGSGSDNEGGNKENKENKEKKEKKKNNNDTSKTDKSKTTNPKEGEANTRVSRGGSQTAHHIDDNGNGESETVVQYHKSQEGGDSWLTKNFMAFIKASEVSGSVGFKIGYQIQLGKLFSSFYQFGLDATSTVSADPNDAGYDVDLSAEFGTGLKDAVSVSSTAKGGYKLRGELVNGWQPFRKMESLKTTLFENAEVTDNKYTLGLKLGIGVKFSFDVDKFNEYSE